MRRLRAGARNPSPRAVTGPRPTDTTIRAQGACWTTGAAFASGGKRGPEPDLEPMAPGLKIAAWSAGRRSVPRQGRRVERRETKVAPTGAPSLGFVRGEK